MQKFLKIFSSRGDIGRWDSLKPPQMENNFEKSNRRSQNEKIAVCLLIAFCFSFCSCNGLFEKARENIGTHTVRFESNEGPPVSKQEIGMLTAKYRLFSKRCCQLYLHEIIMFPVLLIAFTAQETCNRL